MHTLKKVLETLQKNYDYLVAINAEDEMIKEVNNAIVDLANFMAQHSRKELLCLSKSKTL